MTDLGTLGGMFSYGAAINRSGQVTGYAETASGAIHAFVFRYGRMLDLNELICAPDLVLQSGNSINDRGQIVAQALTASGDEHAVLVTPISTLFSELGRRSRGVGPGKGLEAKSGHAWAYYSAVTNRPRVRCWSAFVADVEASSGKEIPCRTGRRAGK